MTLLYVVGTGSRWENNELRYSLRSVCAHVPHEQVVVVGHAPEWLANAVHVPAGDPFPMPWTNQWHKVLLACTDERVPEEWVLMNDDFLFLADHHGPLLVTVEHTLRQRWSAGPRFSADHYMVMRDAMHLLKRKGFPNALDYDTHTPMPMRTDEVLHTAQMFGGHGKAMAWRSMHGNLHEVPCKLGTDPKVYNWPGHPPALPFMSTGLEMENSPQYRKWVAERFPQPCKYEGG